MSYTIKSRYGDDLYVAKDAVDVREALRAAVRARADLYGADLYGADLYGADLYGANLARANLARANLARANLARADLAGANLYGANLAGANLARANLARANLAGANLARADLYGADLAGATGLNAYKTNDLLLLKDQPGKIRMYKLVNQDNTGPTYPGITYEIGESYSVDNANTDEQTTCGAGINLATLPWVIRNWSPGYRILVAEFTAKDIAAIPNSDGKFRVRRCKIVAEKDLVEIGLVEAPDTTKVAA